MQKIFHTLLFLGNYQYLPTVMIFWYLFLAVFFLEWSIFTPAFIIFFLLSPTASMGEFLSKIGLARSAKEGGWIYLGSGYEFTKPGLIVIVLIITLAVFLLNFADIKIINAVRA